MRVTWREPRAHSHPPPPTHTAISLLACRMPSVDALCLGFAVTGTTFEPPVDTADGVEMLRPPPVPAVNQVTAQHSTPLLLHSTSPLLRSSSSSLPPPLTFAPFLLSISCSRCFTRVHGRRSSPSPSVPSSPLVYLSPSHASPSAAETLSIASSTQTPAPRARDSMACSPSWYSLESLMSDSNPRVARV